MERETNRIRFIGSDDVAVVVIEHQHFDIQQTSAGRRIYPGARRYALVTGDSVRVIDNGTYQVIGTGELLCRLD